MIDNAVAAAVVNYGAAYANAAALAANTAVQVVAPGANVNGCIVWRATAVSSSAAGDPFASLVAKASAPATIVDGDVIMGCDGYPSGAGTHTTSAKLDQPVKVAAGKGIYFIATVAEASGVRSCLYTLL